MENVVVYRKPLNDIASDWNNRRIYPRQSSAPTGSYIQEQNGQNLAALLPSKFAYATVRMRNKEDRGNFYRTVRGVMTIRGLRRDFDPDAELLTSGDMDNGPDLDIEQIKELPISMAEKRALNATNHQDSRSFSTSQRKYRYKKFAYRMRQKWNEALPSLQIWQRDMKKIEGNYGTGVVAYFVFIKWLSLLNLFNFIVIFGLIVIPKFFISNPVLSGENGGSTACCDRNDTDLCNAQYISGIQKIRTNFIETLQSIVQGTGFMEDTVFFYGHYQNQILFAAVNNTTLYYNTSIAYILTILVVLFISLFAIVREASKGITYKFHEGDERFYQYCNLIFGGWDFCIDNEKAAQMKRVVVTNEICGFLEAEKLMEERKNRSKASRNMLIFIRIVVNVVQLAILGACGFLIYFVFDKSTEKLNENPESIERFLFEFLPSITIVCMNIVAPIVFRFIIGFERYSPNVTIFILLVRTVFLRLASIIVFYASMYRKIMDIEECDKFCWETFVGQQIYRLALTDFATHIILTFIVNFLRSLLAKKFGHIQIIRLLCEQTFDLPKHVLDIIYTQMLCWLGAFYAPLLPGMFVIIFFLLFYIKKFACLVNSKPGVIIQRTSTSKFMTILLIAFAVGVFPILYTIGEIRPSKACGPFRQYNIIWKAITEASVPQWFSDIAQYATTTYVGIILFIILILLISYYIAVKNANKHMARALKTQLLLEGHDKRFLLEKLFGFMNEQRHTGRTAL